MYDENSFKNYIFWLQVKRVFLMIILSIIGAALGVVLSQFLIDVLLLFDAWVKILIIAISTLLFFAISLLLTTGTGKEVQDGYWKMAVLRKLTVISKKLDCLENLNNMPTEAANIVKEVAKEINNEIHNESISETNLEAFDESSEDLSEAPNMHIPFLPTTKDLMNEIDELEDETPVSPATQKNVKKI